jgi:hypothetical protein
MLALQMTPEFKPDLDEREKRVQAAIKAFKNK